VSLPARGQSLDLDDAKDSVVRVFVTTAEGGGSGTGFIINDRVVATNFHVVAPAIRAAEKATIHVAFLTRAGVEIGPATIRYLLPEKDLAILETELDLLGAPLVLATEDPKLTAEVTAIGFPGAADSAVSGDELDSNALIPSITTGRISRIIP